MWIWVAAALLLAFGVVSAAAAKPAHRSKRRTADQRLNVVVILSDDERSDGTAVMRNAQTLLADHGVTFTDAHVTTSMCGPSRASILTGQYAHHSGVTDNFGAAQLPGLQGRVGVERPRSVDARRRLRDRARGQVRQRLHGRVRQPRDPARLGRLAGDGQRPDGGLLQLRDQRQRPHRALREQAVGLLDHRADAQGRPVHQAARATRSSSTSPRSRRICRRSRRRPTAGSWRTSRRSTIRPSTSATSARSRGASGTRTCSAPPPSSTSTTSGSARRNRCSRSTGASAASCRRSRRATS